MSSIAGELITERLEFDGGRQVTVYVPPVAAEAIVFAGDGHLVSQWRRSLEAADAPSTIIVGVHRLSDETLRLHEYSPGFEPERFAAHEKFFVEDVAGCERASESACPPNRQGCSVSRRAGSWPSPWGFGIQMSTARSSAPLLAAVTGRLALCRARFRARTSSRAPWSRSSETTPPDGRPRFGMPAPKLS
jgi:hypothetical protein